MPLAEEDSVVQVALTSDAHLMDEVLVKGRYSGIKVMGDTIRFDTGYFRTGAEDNLADVLRRLPGVRVEDDGTVSYGNKAVDDVLIDGRKVFDSRDGSAVVATLSAKHVTGAEIWQNYKPDSIDSGKPRSDRQALNVKTDGVKASGNAAIGAGWQDAALADARLMLMRGSASATLRMAANNVRRPTISDTDFQNSLRGTEKWISDNTSTSNYAAGGGVMISPPGDSRRARSAAPQLSLNLRPSGRLTLRLAALGNAMSYGTRSVATETYLSDNSRREWGRESHDIYRFGNVSASAKYKASPKLELGAAVVYSHQDARGSSASTDSSPGGMNLLERRRDNANQLHLTTYATAGVEMGVRSSTITDDTASPQAPADHRTDRTAALRVAFGRESMGLTYKAGARLWRAGASGGGQLVCGPRPLHEPAAAGRPQPLGLVAVLLAAHRCRPAVAAVEALVGHLAAVGLRDALARAPHAHAHGLLLLLPPALGHVCHAQRLALARQRGAAALHSAAGGGQHRVLGRRRAAPLHDGPRGERGAAVGRERKGVVCPWRLAGMAEGGLLPRLGGPDAGRGLLAV